MPDMKELHKETNEQKRVDAGTKVQNRRRRFLVEVVSDIDKECFVSADANEDMSNKIDWLWMHKKGTVLIQFKERPNPRFQDPFMETCLIFPLGQDVFDTSYEWAAGRDFEGKSSCTVFGLCEGLAFVSSIRLKEKAVKLFQTWLGDEKKVKFFKAKNGSLYMEPLISTKTISSWFRRAGASRGGACVVYQSPTMKGAEIWFRIDRSDRRGTYGKLIPYIPLDFLEPYSYLPYKDGEDPDRPKTWVPRDIKMKDLIA